MTLLVAPLAAISLLAAAAAVALNPVLVSVSLTGKKRRRRSLFGLEHDFDSDFSAENSRNGKVLFNGQDATSSITPEVQEKIDEMQVMIFHIIVFDNYVNQTIAELIFKSMFRIRYIHYYL